MATPRDIRRLAFQVLYQLDARGGSDAEAILASIIDDDEDNPSSTAPADFTEAERKKSFLFAAEAYAARAEADAFMELAAPGWPAHRQAAVDRAILRLAHHEMISGKSHPKIAVNEAVELAKKFSTDKSPAFINGLLDKVLKKVLADKPELAELPELSSTPGTLDMAGAVPPAAEEATS